VDDHIAPRRGVILSGGFAELSAMRVLHSAPVPVTLVDRNAHHLFRPPRAVLRGHGNLRCLLATATDVDADGSAVHAGRANGSAVALPCGGLVVGVETHRFDARTGLWAVMQSGAYTDSRIRQAVEGGRRAARPFRYLDPGSAAYIIRGRAVVRMGRSHASAVVGWLIRLFIHIVFLTGFRSRTGTLFSRAVVFAAAFRCERAFTSLDSPVTAPGGSSPCGAAAGSTAPRHDPPRRS